MFYRSARGKRTAMFFAKGKVVHIHGERRDGEVCDKPSIVLDTPVSSCNCDFFVYFKEPQFADHPNFVAKRYFRGKKRSDWEMYDAMCVSVSQVWAIQGAQIVRINLSSEEERVELSMRKFNAINQVEIGKYFHCTPSSTSAVLVTPPHIVVPLRMYDAGYLRRLCTHRFIRRSTQGFSWKAYLMKHVWQEIRIGKKVVFQGVSWHPDGVTSLSNLCLRVLSLSNAAIGGNSYGPNAIYTMTNVGDKQIIRYAKMCGPTHHMNDVGRAASRYVPESIELLNSLMDVEKYRAKATFTADDAAVDGIMLSESAASGRRSGPKVQIPGEYFTVRVTVDGCKVVQEKYAKDKVKHMLRCFRNNMEWDNNDRTWIITFKSEVLFAKTYAEQRKLMSKIRIYFIPTTSMYIIAAMVNGLRQKLERGNIIRIGMTWFYGGANEFANYFKWKDPNMVYFQADFSGLDTTIKYHLLMLYVYSVIFYYNTGGDYDVLKYLIGMAAENLAAKVTNVFGDIWRMMFGVMPSGGYETSHGDSWIVALLYCQYFITTMQRYPGRKGEMMDSLLKFREVIIAVYGDDSVLGVHRKYTSMFNIYGFGKFCGDYYDMKLRDEEVFTCFLSTPNVLTGETLVNGVTFLQRQFILATGVETFGYDVPEVLPYRSARKIVQKSIYGSGDVKTIDEHIMSFIGLAYDTQGTNIVAYNYTRYMYNYLCEVFSRSVEKILDESDVLSNKSIIKLMRKAKITPAEMRQGFPSRQHLMSMHVDDPLKRVIEQDIYRY